MQKVHVTYLIIIIVLSLVFAGCASIIHGSKQNVKFQTSPSGAVVEVKDAMGVSYGWCETPCSIELKRKREYKAFIAKEGYEPVELIISRKSDGWIWGNIVFGGLIGLIVDFSNGAAYKLSPDELSATLSEKTIGQISINESDDAVLIFDFELLSQEEKAKLAGFSTINLSTN
ncbi:MAG: PEGA domain-containing protein [candidate division Zixibacteria bacterium]